jgi:hypothetical protein
LDRGLGAQPKAFLEPAGRNGAGVRPTEPPVLAPTGTGARRRRRDRTHPTPHQPQLAFKEVAVPYIIIEADTDDGTWTLKERVTPDDMGSELFCNHLVERLRWAIADVVSAGSQATEPAGRSPRSWIVDAPSQLS